MRCIIMAEQYDLCDEDELLTDGKLKEIESLKTKIQARINELVEAFKTWKPSDNITKLYDIMTEGYELDEEIKTYTEFDEGEFDTFRDQVFVLYSSLDDHHYCIEYAHLFNLLIGNKIDDKTWWALDDEGWLLILHDWYNGVQNVFELKHIHDVLYEELSDYIDEGLSAEDIEEESEFSLEDIKKAIERNN
jgi:hypothetical protein